MQYNDSFELGARTEEGLTTVPSIPRHYLALVLVAVLPRDHHRSYQPEEPRVWAMRTSMYSHVVMQGPSSLFTISSQNESIAFGIFRSQHNAPGLAVSCEAFRQLPNKNLRISCVLTKLGVISLLDSHITAVVPISSQIYCTPRPSSLALAQA
jgi:hypothetical protein